MAKIDFIEDLKLISSSELSKLGYKTKEKYKVETILDHYFNIIFRLPPVQNWTIKQSQELIDKTHSLRPSIKQGLEQFIKNAERGNNLKPWMSENINNADYLDLMFYDWGIYHFHLGTKTDEKGKNQGLIKRTDEVLLAIRSPNKSIMCLIDIRSHKQKEELWYKQELIDIIENNWSNILDMYTLPNVVELLNAPSDDGIKQLRTNGINSTIQTSEGRVLIPINGGYTSTKMSSPVITNRITFMMRTKQFEKDFIDSIEKETSNDWTIVVRHSFLDTFLDKQIKASEILHFFKQQYRKNWDDLEFHLKDIIWSDNNYGYLRRSYSLMIEELSTGVQLAIYIGYN